MPTHYKGSPREIRALNTFIKMMRASECLNAKLQQALTKHDITPGQLGVLEALLHLGPMNQQELGAKLLRSKANTCTVLENLEKAGLIERERGITDRRTVTVMLSGSGRKLIQKVFPDHAARITDLLSGLTAEEQETLASLCKKLGTAIGE